ncbi:3-deoxy-D-manno-octulosonic acid transferase [Marivita sp. S0852]|uniref:3-deoxy-D-manno-octulosonic acid transferase n=1 Tax=Marivita sp. S0852 TaxID=3373893 RepID=UPI0039825114
MLLYRLLMMVLAGGMVGKLCLRRDWTTLGDRLGRSGPKDGVARLWIHAASNGELGSVKPVIDALIADGWHVLITVNTPSARDMAIRWALPHTDIRLAPVDLPHVVQRMFRAWTVTAYITVETDVWPQRILTCPGPVLVLGGRLTERSAKGWARFAALTARVLDRVDYLSAQDAASQTRFRKLGLRDAATGPVFDLKALYTPPEMPVPADLEDQFDRHSTWLAASTHAGEEAVILDAHKRARDSVPQLKLILAPRHPKRGDDIADLIEASGLSYARRSKGTPPDTADVYLADTFGEMPIWYQLAGTTFIAGSLSDRGGHTPYEPAAFASALLHGPDVHNFRAAYGRLQDHDAAIMISSADALAKGVVALSDPAKQAQMGQAAQAALRQDTDLETLLRDINTALGA